MFFYFLIASQLLRNTNLSSHSFKMETAQIIIFHIILVMGCGAQETFRNPIIDGVAPHPTVIKHQDFYYLTFEQGNHIDLLKSSTLSNFRNAERTEIHRDANEGVALTTPTIHSFQGELYIYYSKLENITDGTSRRMYGIKCLDPREPLGAWTAETRILPEDEVVALHGNQFQYNNGALYFIWTRELASTPPKWELYIARMESPLKVVAPGTLLRTPTMDWETRVRPINYAPVIVQTHGRTLLTFTASAYNSPDRCLGIMGIDGGRDPMLPSNWWNDVNHCVFAGNDAEEVWAPGIATFVRSKDDSELWMMYDARDHSEESGVNRTTRIQKVEWEFNNPMFPPAMGFSRDLAVPQGE